MGPFLRLSVRLNNNRFLRINFSPEDAVQRMEQKKNSIIRKVRNSWWVHLKSLISIYLDCRKDRCSGENANSEIKEKTKIHSSLLLQDMQEFLNLAEKFRPSNKHLFLLFSHSPISQPFTTNVYIWRIFF